MPYGRTKFWKTLRFRLTFWNTLTLLVLAAGTLLCVREGIRWSLWTEADAQLIEDAHEVRLAIVQLYPDLKRIEAELNRKSISHTHRGLYIRIYDEHLKEVFVGENAPETIFPVQTYKPHGLTPVSPQGGHYRLVHFEIDQPGMPDWTVRLGTSFAPLEASVTQLTRLLTIIGLGVLLITPVGGYWLAGRATSPIAEIISTTARLRPTNLDQRLQIRGTRDELDRLSATINGFLDRIGAFIQQNQEFTANAAHELRSPLTAIQSSLEVALNTDRTVDEYKELIELVLDQCEGLRVLVNHLLLLAESDAGRLDVANENVDLGKVIVQSCEMFQAVAEAEEIQLRVHLAEHSGGVIVRGHSGSLRQVVNNLIDNAIKFTPHGGCVDVRLKTEDDFALLTIADTGIGISPADLPNVFRRFYRGDRSRARTGRSSGLGLSICESIVGAHQGTISIESQVGRGTTLIVKLPLRSETVAASPAQTTLVTAS